MTRSFNEIVGFGKLAHGETLTPAKSTWPVISLLISALTRSLTWFLKMNGNSSNVVTKAGIINTNILSVFFKVSACLNSCNKR